MKKSFLFIVIVFGLSIFSCKKDDSGSCTTCSSPVTTSFEVCQESDGNAWVNGQNTGTDYNTYIQDLEEAGATCGN